MALVVPMLAASIAISSTVEVVAVGTSWLGLASAAGLGISVAWPGFERELAAYLRDPSQRERDPLHHRERPDPTTGSAAGPRCSAGAALGHQIF